MNRIDYSITRVDSVLSADWRRPDTADRQDTRRVRDPQSRGRAPRTASRLRHVVVLLVQPDCRRYHGSRASRGW